MKTSMQQFPPHHMAVLVGKDGPLLQTWIWLLSLVHGPSQTTGGNMCNQGMVKELGADSCKT